MSLEIEYFIDQTHITDLQKLKNEELYFIIRLFRGELEKFNESGEFKLKGLIIACNNMKDLIKDFRFILNGYLEVINNYSIPVEEDPDQIFNNMNKINFLDSHISFCHLEEIEDLLKEMDKIEKILDKIKTVRLLKEKVDELAEKCIYKMRIFYDSLGEFILWDSRFWDKIDLEKKNFIIKKCHNQAKAAIA